MKTIEDIVRERGGIWPFETKHENLYWDNYTETCFPFWYSGQITTYICTRTEFEECTKKLRNEPSWDDAPDWAVAYAQDSDGEWYWYDVVPRPNTAMFKAFPGKSEYAGKGEVIGDWKQTLRLRLEEKKMGSEMGNEKNWLKDVREAFTKNAEEFDSLLMSVLNRIESHEELEESEPTGDWYAKGEFPPVGAEFEFSFNGKSWDERVMISNDGISFLMAHIKYPNIRWSGSCNERNMHFRPLQTEREQLIEKACKVVSVSGSIKETVTQLANAGMLKMPEK